MNISEAQVKKILLGDVHCKFGQLSLNMLINRLEKLYKKETSSANLTYCTQELNSFINKYATIMKQDYELISQV